MSDSTIQARFFYHLPSYIRHLTSSLLHQTSSIFLHPSFLSLLHYSRDSSICSSPTELPYIYSLYRVMLPYDAMKQNYPHSFLIFQFHLALYFSNLLLTFLHSAFFYLQLQCSSCSEEAVQNHLQIFFQFRNLLYKNKMLLDVQSHVIRI